MNNIYGISFKNDGKVYYFCSDLECPINVTVIVETEKGQQFGKVACKLDYDKLPAGIGELKNILRISTKSDYNQYLKNLKDANDALESAKSMAMELNLDMTFMESNFTFDRKQLLLTFIADERIDFRELARKLAAKYRTRIELRQVGARDRAKATGGIGICGRTLCCSTFLNHIGSVNMNMAKDQNIALNPNKINGVCGRLLCCLTYEDEEYLNCSKGMPNVGQIQTIAEGTGKVLSVDILNRKYKILVNNELIEIELKSCESCKK